MTENDLRALGPARKSSEAGNPAERRRWRMASAAAVTEPLESVVSISTSWRKMSWESWRSAAGVGFEDCCAGRRGARARVEERRRVAGSLTGLW